MAGWATLSRSERRLRLTRLITLASVSLVLLLSVCVAGGVRASSGFATTATSRQADGAAFQTSNPYEGAGAVRVLMQTHAHPFGDIEPAVAVARKYADRGYGALSVSDFGKLDWPWPAKPELMIPVKGEEFSVGGIRHFINLFGDFLPPPNPDPQACIDGIRSKGGIAIVCHPNFYWFYTPADGWNIDALAALNGLTGIEIFDRRVADL